MQDWAVGRVTPRLQDHPDTKKTAERKAKSVRRRRDQNATANKIPHFKQKHGLPQILAYVSAGVRYPHSRT